MSLTDAQVERYSRQIILPEVGGRGQARLLAARVTLAGGSEAAATAALLLGRAGIGWLDLVDGPPALSELAPECHVERHAADALPPPGDVVVDLGGEPVSRAALGRWAQAAGRPFVVGRRQGPRLTVATLVGRPCAACLRADAGLDGPAGAAHLPAALTLAALAAGEALRMLLDTPRTGRQTTVALDSGAVTIAAPAAAASCPVCGGRG